MSETIYRRVSISGSLTVSDISIYAFYFLWGSYKSAADHTYLERQVFQPPLSTLGASEVLNPLCSIQMFKLGGGFQKAQQSATAGGVLHTEASIGGERNKKTKSTTKHQRRTHD